MYEARNESRRLDIHEKDAEAQRIKGLQAQYDEKMKTINKTDPHFGIESQDVSKSTVGAGAGTCLVYKKFGTKTVAVVGLLGVAALGTYKLHEDVNKITGHNDIKIEKTEKIDGNSVEVEGTGNSYSNKYPWNELPTSGERPFEPHLDKSGNPILKKGPNNGMLDKYGNEWTVDKAGAKVGNLHWDVQHPDGSHMNVNPQSNNPGGIHHGSDNF